MGRGGHKAEMEQPGQTPAARRNLPSEKRRYLMPPPARRFKGGQAAITSMTRHEGMNSLAE